MAISQQGRGQRKRGQSVEGEEGMKTQAPRCGARLEVAISKGDAFGGTLRSSREGAGTSGCDFTIPDMETGPEK